MQNNGIQNFKFWCQKVLPLVFDDSLSYYEVLCKLSSKLNEVINTINQIVPNIIQIAKDIINQALQNGEILLKTEYNSQSKTLKFIYGKVETNNE
jgi:hypothetical protein